MSDERMDEISGDLSEIFGEIVSVDVLSENLTDGAGVVVCNMSYRPDSRDHDTHHRRVKQTAVVLDADDLDLPKFTLGPHVKGVVGKIFSMIGADCDINFDDSPEFSAAYLLQAWAEEPVRILFTREVRDYFANAPGWNVRGNNRQLVIFRRGTVIDEAALDEFIAESLGILQLFRDAERKLDNSPDVRRDITGDDLLRTSERMGAVGSVLARQFKTLSLTEEELTEFHKESAPRNIPPGMKRQVVGDNLPLVYIGLFFCVAGIVVGALIFAFASEHDRWIGALFAAFMPLTGGPAAGITIWYRRRKIRLLRDGVLTSGNVVKVSATSTQVNGQVRHIARVQYEYEGKKKTTTCNVYSTAAERARRFKDTGQSVTVLVDPKDPGHVTCTDFLLLFSS